MSTQSERNEQPGPEWESKKSLTVPRLKYYWKMHGPYMLKSFPAYRFVGRQNRTLMPLNVFPIGEEFFEQVLYRIEVMKLRKKQPFMYISYSSYSRTNLLLCSINEHPVSRKSRYWHCDVYIGRTHMTVSGPTYHQRLSKSWDQFFEEAKELLREYLTTGKVVSLSHSEVV